MEGGDMTMAHSGVKKGWVRFNTDADEFLLAGGKTSVVESMSGNRD